MITEPKTEYLVGLVQELRKLPNETEWVEFKRNYANPEIIGEYLSALANSAAFCGKTKAYIVWGIDDETHAIQGTDFKPSREKKVMKSWKTGSFVYFLQKSNFDSSSLTWIHLQ